MKYFTKKFNTPGELNAEFKGVRKLEQFVRTPEIVEVKELEIHYEFIRQGKPDFKKAGEELFKLHQVSNEFFGLNEDNFIGKGIQINTPENDCKSFYLKHRIGVQVARLRDQKIQKIMNEVVIHLEDSWWPNCTRPSLCHGDLWSGNLLFDEFSNPVFIDPAIYFGDPLSDLAMASLFGGFPDEFFSSYTSESNLTLDRLDILVYQLYHSLNHVNIFGASYNSMVINHANEINSLL